MVASVWASCQRIEPANTHTEQSGTGPCKKKLQLVKAAPTPVKKGLAKHHPLPLDASVATEYAALYFGLLFPDDQGTLIPDRGPDAGNPQVFANHPKKAPPVRFS